jgi:hypothetical protein
MAMMAASAFSFIKPDKKVAYFSLVSGLITFCRSTLFLHEIIGLHLVSLNILSLR